MTKTNSKGETMVAMFAAGDTAPITDPNDPRLSWHSVSEVDELLSDTETLMRQHRDGLRSDEDAMAEFHSIWDRWNRRAS